jgi:hypothetical protein
MSDKETVDIFGMTDVPVTVTYEGMGGGSMTFHLRPWMQKEERDARQAHFALADEEKEKKTPEHNLEMLAGLSTRAPEGVPGFVPTNLGVAGDIRNFFGDGNPMKEKVVADVMTRYYRVTQPAEFFRGV